MLRSVVIGLGALLVAAPVAISQQATPEPATQQPADPAPAEQPADAEPAAPAPGEAEPAAGETGTPDPALMEQGAELYQLNCVACHQPGGEGRPPSFPALGGNENLADLELIVRNVHEGQGNMPPFPNLTAEEIAALATYIRNSWGNAFGAVSVEEVTAILEGPAAEGEEAATPQTQRETAEETEPAEDVPPVEGGAGDAADGQAPDVEAPPAIDAEPADEPAAEAEPAPDAAQPDAAGADSTQVSVWDGVYTEEQAMRGMDTYEGVCAACHGRRLNGAPDDPDRASTPPLARSPFLRDWDGRTVATLYEMTRATMPIDNPGYLSDQEYIDIIAYMFSVSGMPAGEEELPPDSAALADIVIEQEE